MHLWPSLRLRDSFTHGYLKKLEWNLQRMNTQKQKQKQESDSNNQQKLLDENNSSSGIGNDSKEHPCVAALFLCRELLMILSCCYCCFCCGACVEDEDG